LIPDAPSLTLRSSPGQGMFVHLAKARRDKKGLDFDPAFHSLMETGTTKGYFHRASGFVIVLFLSHFLFFSALV
jgi:hypothetical protein